MIQNGLLMRGGRVVIPTTLRKEILAQLYTGRQGITKCHEMTRQSVWWPSFGKQLEDLIQHCPVCCQERLQPVEPLISSESLVYHGRQLQLTFST